MNCSLTGPFSLFHFISMLCFGAGVVVVDTYAALTSACSWRQAMERIAVLLSGTSNRVVRLKSKGINLLKLCAGRTRVSVCVCVFARVVHNRLFCISLSPGGSQTYDNTHPNCSNVTVPGVFITAHLFVSASVCNYCKHIVFVLLSTHVCRLLRCFFSFLALCLYDDNEFHIFLGADKASSVEFYFFWCEFNKSIHTVTSIINEKNSDHARAVRFSVRIRKLKWHKIWPNLISWTKPVSIASFRFGQTVDKNLNVWRMKGHIVRSATNRYEFNDLIWK